jgi:hypothetical protein
MSLTFAELADRLMAKDEEILKEAARAAVQVLKLFDHDWFNWEVLGWALARLLGISEKELEENPEVGWAVKGLVGHALSRSGKRQWRLIGETLLDLTEMPPEAILVRFGRHKFLPALVAHYRISWQFLDIREEYQKVCRKLMGVTP